MKLNIDKKLDEYWQKVFVKTEWTRGEMKEVHRRAIDWNT